MQFRTLCKKKEKEKEKEKEKDTGVGGTPGESPATNSIRLIVFSTAKTSIQKAKRPPDWIGRPSWPRVCASR